MVERQESQREAWIDVQFLRQAVEQVIDCRRVLKYTYALGYFLQDGSPEKHLFEHQQEMLEKNTERLQEFTEMDILAVERTQVSFMTFIVYNLWLLQQFVFRFLYTISCILYSMFVSISILIVLTLSILLIVQVVNLTRVTERFMNELLATTEGMIN